MLVSFEPLERIRWYLADAPFAWPVLLDPDRHLYKAYGFERTSFRRAWLSPRTLAHYLRAALKGRLPHRPVADTLQLGGDVLIDPPAPYGSFTRAGSRPTGLLYGFCSTWRASGVPRRPPWLEQPRSARPPSPPIFAGRGSVGLSAAELWSRTMAPTWSSSHRPFHAGRRQRDLHIRRNGARQETALRDADTVGRKRRGRGPGRIRRTGPLGTGRRPLDRANQPLPIR